jgi:hypothetical protein
VSAVPIESPLKKRCRSEQSSWHLVSVSRGVVAAGLERIDPPIQACLPETLRTKSVAPH